MTQDYMRSIGLILAISVGTAILQAVRAFGPAGKQAATPGALIGYLVAGMVFGWVSIFIYHWIGSRWPVSAMQIFFWLAFGMTVLLTVMALAMPFTIKSAWLDVAVWTAMNILWGAGYGWFLPQLLKAATQAS
jgi:hypothetical protein